MAGAAASRSRGCLCACEARRFRAAAAGAGARRWPPRRPAISRARWRSRAPRSTRPNSPWRARRWRRSSLQPTQRVAMLMAEIERTEHGDTGRARAWTLRAVRALHDPAWTADGYVSDRWRPVSPVTAGSTRSSGRRRSQPAVRQEALRSKSSPFEEAMLAAPHRAVVLEPPAPAVVEPAPSPVAVPAPSAAPAIAVAPAVAACTAAEQDNAPPAAAEPEPLSRHRRSGPR